MTDLAQAPAAAEPSSPEPTEIERLSDEVAVGLGLIKEPDEPVERREAPGTPRHAVAEPAPETEKPEAPPPLSWAKEAHPLWAAMAPEARAQVVKREEDMLRGLEQYKEFHGIGKQMNEVIAPYRAKIIASGMPEEKAVAAVLAGHYRLTEGSHEQRAAYYRQLGEALGLVQPGHIAAEQAQMTPAERAIKAELDQVKGALEERRQQVFREKYQQIDNEVGAFESAKDANGNLLHPFFAEVGDAIVRLLNADKGLSLNDAYEMACWANPVTREKSIEAREKHSVAERTARAREEAEKARQATRTNVRRRDTEASSTGKPGTMDDTLKETLSAIRKRTAH